MTVVTADPAATIDPPLPARQEAFVRAELIRRLFEGSKQSRYFSFVLWPVIAAIYWRQVDLLILAPPFVAHIFVTLGFDILRRRFNKANPPDEEVIRWGRWFAALSFLAGACWGVAGYMLASKDYELQRMLLVALRPPRACSVRPAVRPAIPAPTMTQDFSRLREFSTFIERASGA